MRYKIQFRKPLAKARSDIITLKRKRMKAKIKSTLIKVLLFINRILDYILKEYK